MALKDEELVEYWLNNQGFFCMRGVKEGLREIDILAMHPLTGERWHYEVQVSFRPIGYVGGDNNARKRSPDEIAEGVQQWIGKKFHMLAERRNAILPGCKFAVVLGVLRDELEAELMKQNGIRVIRYRNILEELKGKKPMVNSDAGHIVELLRYEREQVSEDNVLRTRGTELE